MSLVPALGHEVQLHAGRRGADVAAAGRRMHLLERVEVVVHRRAAERAHVRDRDAVDVPRVLVGLRAARGVVALLAALVAADVDAVHLDARDGLQDDPRVARGRDRLQLLLIDHRAVLDLARVEQRGLAADDDGGLDARDLERGARVRVLADRDLHVGLGDLAEALQLVDQRVAAGVEVQETVLAPRVGRLHFRCADAGERDGDAGKTPALLVGDVAEDVAHQLLRRERWSEREHGEERDDWRPRPCSRSRCVRVPTHAFKPLCKKLLYLPGRRRDGDLSASPPFRRDARLALRRKPHGEQPRCHGATSRARDALVPIGARSGTNSPAAWTRIAAARSAERAIRSAGSRINGWKRRTSGKPVTNAPSTRPRRDPRRTPSRACGSDRVRVRLFERGGARGRLLGNSRARGAALRKKRWVPQNLPRSPEASEGADWSAESAERQKKGEAEASPERIARRARLS